MRRRASGSVAALAASLLGLVACDDGAPAACEQCWCDPAAAAPAADVELGKFDGVGFAPLANGDTLDVYAGPQGGHHFLIAVRTRAIDITSTRTLLSASQGGTDVDVLSCPYRTPYVSGADGWASLRGAAALVLDESWLASGAAEGAQVTVRVEVQDDRGAYGFDERTILTHLLPSSRRAPSSSVLPY